MKKLIIILTMLLLPFGAAAQTRSFGTFYDKYAGRDGYVTVEMSGKMFNVINGNSNKTVKMKKGDTSLGQIDNLIIIISEESDREFRADIRTLVSRGKYSPMTLMQEGGNTFECYSVGENGKASEFLMIGEEDGRTSVLCITGTDLSVSQISQIARTTGGK